MNNDDEDVFIYFLRSTVSEVEIQKRNVYPSLSVIHPSLTISHFTVHLVSDSPLNVTTFYLLAPLREFKA